MWAANGVRGVRACMARKAFYTGPSVDRQGTAPRHLHASVCCQAADTSSELTTRIKEDMKVAMKAKDTDKLAAIRFLSAAIKQREIKLREGGKEVNDAEVLGVIQKMAKQRRDSIEQYKSGGRTDLADKEEQELKVLLGYLPAQLSKEEVEKVVTDVINEVGATSVKQMGAVMKGVTAKVAGRADNKMVSELVKAALQPQK
eukprot:GHUV01001901.1.p1 GENE.GHUV01001901.1~~GHUV01001901.1.p1  ORF type:complete len:201 (+),score=43.98 GHUV01001901.1:206-808(+)